MPAFRSIEKEIYTKRADMPANQKKIADFFLNNLNLVALMPIKVIAENAGVSQPTIVRFAQTLGYSGFKELKEALSESLKERLTPAEQLQVGSSPVETRPDVMSSIAQNAISNIKQTVEGFERSDLVQIVDAIISSKRIYCLGLEISSHFSRLLTFLLQLYTYNANYLSLEFLHFQEQIAFMNEQDLLIAFSFSPYSREAVEAVQFAQQQGVHVVVFTDKKSAPAARYADTSVCIKTDNYMFSNSWGAVSVVVNSIITELNYRDKERTMKALETIEKNISNEKYFIVDHSMDEYVP